MAERGRRVVVTGATGLIGRKIIARLAQQGDRPIAFVRDTDAARRANLAAAEYVAWSSSMREGAWAEAIDGADAVIHLAGAPVAKRWSARQKDRVLRTRVEGTRHLVQAIAAAKRPPGILLSGSAVGYYGTSTSATFTEASGPGSDFLATTCAAWEHEADEARKLGVRVATIRIGIVLALDGGALKRLITPFKFFVGGPVAPGTQAFPWVHVDDVVGMFMQGLDDAAFTGALNAVAPGIVTAREFAKALGHALGRPALFTVPRFVIRLIMGEGAYILTEGQVVRPERTLAAGYRFAFSEIGEAIRDLLARR